MKLIGRVFLAIPAIGAAVACGAQPDRTATFFDGMRHGVVHVGELAGDGSSMNRLGCGFVVDDVCTVATTTHAVKQAAGGSLAIQFRVPSDPTKVSTVRMRVAHVSPFRDIAFLRAEVSGREKCMVGGLVPLAFHDKLNHKALAGKEVLIFGYPTLMDQRALDIPAVRTATLASGDMRAFGERMLLLDTPSAPGFSGGPVILQESGRVVGIVPEMPLPELAPAFSWATPASLEDYERAMQAFE